MSRRCLWGCCVCAALLLLCAAACAEEVYLEQVYVTEQTADWRVLEVPEDTFFPVYAAPFPDAYRPGAGKAAVSAAEPFKILAAAGEWRLVWYAVSGTAGRVGWTKLPLEAESRDDFPCDGKLLRLSRGANLTDDPWGKHRVVTRLREGETVIGLARFWRDGEDDGKWFYVETEVDGQTAWLFIEQSAVEPVPLYHMEGTVLVIQEGVTRVGSSVLFSEYDEEEDTSAVTLIPLKKGEVALNDYDMWEFTAMQLYDAETGKYTDLTGIVFPASVTALGAEAIWGGHMEELRLPENLEYLSPDALGAVDIGRLIIPAGFRLGLDLYFDYTVIGAFDVEEGNALYSSRDGVLFSADGKTLLRYPNGKKDLHYDIPAGVEEIADYAFMGEMDNPLQTLSLPMGLKRIGRYAFSGLGRLHSLAVPLTVREIGEGAFSCCVSLERLSLPPWVPVPERSRWAEFGDFTWYNGDNGTTVVQPKHDDWDEDDFR